MTVELLRKYEKALKKLKSGDRSGAKSLFELCLEIEPEHVESLYRLGEIARDESRPDEALAFWTKVFSNDPQYKNVGLKLARLYFDSANYSQASRLLDQHLSVFPEHGTALNLRGLINGRLLALHECENEIEPKRPLSVRSAWGVQQAVWRALLIREINARFSGRQFGYLWIILEPGFQVLALAAAFYVLRTKHSLSDLPLTVFLLIGVVPWLMTRNVLRMSVNVVRQESSLYNYRQINPIDPILVFWLMECVIYSLLLAIGLGLLWWAGVVFSLSDPLQLIETLAGLQVLSLGLGINIAIICALSPGAKQFIKISLRVLHFMSGVFYTVDMLPIKMQYPLLWNPILNAMDLIKQSFVAQYDSPASALYLWVSALSLLFVGLFVYQRVKQRLVQS